MGRSYTYHFLGLGHIIDGKRSIYPAINRREMAQQMEMAKKNNDEIVEWEAQTKTGRNILGCSKITASKIRLPKMVTCPICEGKGGSEPSNGLRHQCPVCNGSGITTPGYWLNWQDWQLEIMRGQMS